MKKEYIISFSMLIIAISVIIATVIIGYCINKDYQEMRKNWTKQSEEYNIEYQKYLAIFKEKYEKCYLIEVRGYGGTSHFVHLKTFYTYNYSIDNGILTFYTFDKRKMVINNNYIIEEISPEEYVKKNFDNIKLEFGAIK